MGTSDAGLFRFDGQQFQHIAVSGAKHISALHVNRAGDIMMGYDGEGVGIYHPKTGLVTDNPYYSRDVDLTTSKVFSIAEDQSGNVWL